jgi:hypothetical protein
MRNTISHSVPVPSPIIIIELSSSKQKGNIIMASLKLAYGAVLGTVAGAATSVSSVFTATNNSIAMLEAFITKASTEQKLNHLDEAELFVERLLDKHAEEVTKLKAKAEAFCAQSPAHRIEYDAAKANLKAKIERLYPNLGSTPVDAED